jgi:hypothetical protein
MTPTWHVNMIANTITSNRIPSAVTFFPRCQLPDIFDEKEKEAVFVFIRSGVISFF